MDNTDLFPPNDNSVYQMLIGSLQWAVTLVRWDMQYSTNTFTHFAQNQRDGHLKQALRVFGYLKHHSKGKIYLDTESIFYDEIEFGDEYQTKCYPDDEEYIDAEHTPDQKVKTFLITVFKDASHGT